jgi:hypothetical protein
MKRRIPRDIEVAPFPVNLGGAFCVHSRRIDGAIDANPRPTVSKRGWDHARDAARPRTLTIAG